MVKVAIFDLDGTLIDGILSALAPGRPGASL